MRAFSVSFVATAKIAMMSPSPFQVWVVSSVELHRSLDGAAAGCGIRWRWRPPFTGRTWFGNGRRHGCHAWEVTVVVVMLLVMVIVVVIVHMQIRRRVQPRAGHRLVLGTVGFRCFHFDVGHLQRLVVESGEHLRVHHLIHLEPRGLLRFVRVMAVLKDRVLHVPRTRHGRLEEVAQDRLISGLDDVLVIYHQSLQHRIEVGCLVRRVAVPSRFMVHAGAHPLLLCLRFQFVASIE